MPGSGIIVSRFGRSSRIRKIRTTVDICVDFATFEPFNRTLADAGSFRQLRLSHLHTDSAAGNPSSKLPENDVISL